jgi:hypothetical protein
MPRARKSPAEVSATRARAAKTRWAKTKSKAKRRAALAPATAASPVNKPRTTA